MIVIPPIVLNMLMTNIVEATHSLTDEHGKPAIMSTIAEKALRMAAIHAIASAVGEQVWAGDQIIRIDDGGPRRSGIFEHSR